MYYKYTFSLGVIVLELGEVIKYLRKDHKMTQDDLASALGVKKSAVQKYESGIIRHLKVGTIRDLCVLFNVVPFVFVFPDGVVPEHLAYRNRFELLDKPSSYNNVEYSWISNVFYKLNDAGLEKWKEYGEDISLIEKYKNKQKEN